VLPSPGKSRIHVRFLPPLTIVHPLIAISVTAAGLVAWRAARDRAQSAERLAAATLESLLNAIDANDRETGAHVRRVADYALLLATAAELEPRARREVERVALFHDVGKISEALFDIVHDDAELSPEERDAIATHPARGAEVLAPLCAFYPELPEGVIAHHERWDGGGYPSGLRGEEIPLAARIVAIADSFDAITHSRRYRAGTDARHAADAIAEGRGTQFDPRLVDLFLSPPVFSQIEARLNAPAPDDSEGPILPAPRIVRSERRARQKESGVPNVSFRWREQAGRGDRARR
jgi:HD-GYP domain-containing protein (c-di-GMP phosphodiesterase class II)